MSRYNKEWNAPATKDQQLQFKKAMRVVEEELHYHVKGQAVVLLPAFQIVEDAWRKREEFHPSGEFLWFESPCPWKDHLYEKESEEKKDGLIKFAFYQDERKMIRVQTVAPKGNHFAQRVSLHKAWHGLRKKDFEGMLVEGDESNAFLKEVEFVHHSGFIGGAWTLEAAVKMAEASMAEDLRVRTEAAEAEQRKKAELLAQQQA